MPRKKSWKEKKYWFKHNKEEKMKYKHHGAGGGIYFLGFIGAAIYYMQQSFTFWQGVVGILKALVWPAFLVFSCLDFK